MTSPFPCNHDQVIQHLDDDGKYHREGGPAIITRNGGNIWYRHGELHREDGPAIVLANGTKKWYINDKRHREDGPAVEYENGNKLWYRHDVLHREDGPASEHFDGTKHWFINGMPHRIDGPASEYADGRKQWTLYGRKVSEKEHNELLSKPTPPPIPETPFQKLIALFTAHPELIEKSVDVAAEVEHQIQQQI